MEKYIISSEIYSDNYMKDYKYEKNYDTICVKGAMGIGKTKTLKNLFKKYKKIIIISFRITLDKEYVKNFDGFKLYSDIDGNIYDTNVHNRIVVQIDSFHKITGNCDLLVLDEITYTQMHLIQRAKHRIETYRIFEEYIKNIPKIITLDVLMDSYIIKWLNYLGRKIHYIENKFQKHDDKKIINYSKNVGTFLISILNKLKNNEKVILATNCKSFLRTLEKAIISEIPNIPYLLLSSDNSDDINLENWNMYNIVAYTPTIVAGISYEAKHFDYCFGYFINTSSSAEMSLQQLFRVRNLNKSEIHLCIEIKGDTNLPSTKSEVEEYIINRNSCLVEGFDGINISRINKKIIKDHYFYMFLHIQMLIFESNNSYEKRLIILLKNQGIKHIEDISPDINAEKDNKKTRGDMIRETKLYNKKIIDKIIIQPDIDYDTFMNLENKTYLSIDEKLQKRKYKFKDNFNIYDKEIDADIFQKYEKKVVQFKNMQICYEHKDKLEDYLIDQIQNQEDEKIKKNEDAENEIINTSNTYILHSSKKYEKIIMGIEILRKIGFNGPLDEKTINIDYNKLFDYLIKREYNFRLAFKTKKVNWEDIKNDDKANQIALKYINSRLKSLFNIYIECINKKENEYKIKGVDFWCDTINPKQNNFDILLNNLINCTY
jgi:hypothetical protein